MKKEEFFAKIKTECGNERNYYIELLKLRGFLIDVTDNEIRLSDNSHSEDAKYLAEVMGKSGKIVDDVILLNDDLNTEEIEELFSNTFPIGAEAFSYNYGWDYFVRRNCSRKVPVKMLDAFVARFVKAINACCVMTCCCCDGNFETHRRSSRNLRFSEMRIEIENGASGIWYRLICEKYLANSYPLKWSRNFCFIRFNEETQYDTYYEVNKMAKFLYSKRQELRAVKKQATDGFTPSFLRHHTYEEITEVFVQRVRDILKPQKLLLKPPYLST